ncbi:MAG: hypothetical protein ACI86M_002304 [Saprospiraceae bacterium]
MSLQKISENLLLALKTHKPYQQFVDELALIPVSDISDQITDDNKKKAFWINIYNSYFLILRKHQKVVKPSIYTDKLITITSQKMTLDEIEHGILRKYRIKKSLGYLPNLFAPAWIKNWAVHKIDFRIHFALNCGAASCPPIAFYNNTRIETQLEMATLSFLESETKIDKENKRLHLSQLFKWYMGDFGGKSGSRKIVSEYLKTNVVRYKIEYTPYNYTEELDNFVEL